MPTATLNGFGLFGDEVFTSTDLNRRSGEVLNHAREAPVTISRNNEQFALMRREQAATLLSSLNRVKGALVVLLGVDAALSGRELPPAVSWLRVYEKDDLRKLHSEVLEATAMVVLGTSESSHLDAIIHEWRESALVAQSGLLDSVIYEEPDETPLPSPEEVVSLLRPGEDVACATK